MYAENDATMGEGDDYGPHNRFKEHGSSSSNL